MLIRTTLAAAFFAGLLAASARAQQGAATQKSQAPQTDAVSSAVPGDAKTKKQSEESALGPHDGALRRFGDLQVEVLVEPDGLRLYIYNQQGQQVDVGNARGVAALRASGDAKRRRYELFPVLRKDKTAEALAATADLSPLAGKRVEIAFQVAGVPGAERRTTTFNVSANVAPSKQQRVAAAIAAQEVCPVSGQALGSMGEPIPVTIGAQTVYVCCAGCVDAVKANPTKYLPRMPAWTVAPATDSDAAAIARQKTCPVMDEPLGSMGTPIKVTGLERDVFLCCKGCVKFLEKEPAKYLAKLPPLDAVGEQANE